MRRQAVAIALAKSGVAREEAGDLLGKGFVAATQPSFHYIPRGDTMADESDFDIAYGCLAEHTDDFAAVSEDTLIRALTEKPAVLAPLRMILGFTYNELSWAMKLTRAGTTTSGTTLRNFERGPEPERMTARRSETIETIAATACAVMDRSILQIPESARRFFHSKLDKRDTVKGWQAVAVAAGGVPYSALPIDSTVGPRPPSEAVSVFLGKSPSFTNPAVLVVFAAVDHHRGTQQDRWYVRDDLGLRVTLVNPDRKNPSPQELARSATYVKRLWKSHLRRSQFPDVLTDEVGTITKPPGW